MNETTKITTTTTVDDLIEMARAGTLEDAYRDLRDRLATEYDLHVGPRASRSVAARVAHRRAAGGHHSVAADRLERDSEERAADYDRMVQSKYLAAILTGRYDGIECPTNPDADVARCYRARREAR